MGSQVVSAGDGHWLRIPGALVAAAVLLALASVLAGCGSSDDEPKAQARKGNFTVAITPVGYSPIAVRVRQGETITWINTGATRATVENSWDEPFHFDTHTIYPGQSKSVKFTRPGSYDYFASYDASQFSGTVEVVPKGSDGDR